MNDELFSAIEAAERWAMHDPDPVTRSAVDNLVDASDSSLIDLFGGRLAFGTAGLRATVGPGPERMNALVVRQTSRAVVAWLRDGDSSAVHDAPTVVIGFDARADSANFARHAAAAVLAGGGVPLLADAPTPTPVVAHALLHQGAAAGIVITASHNPPADNGFKLYLGDGMQLVSPADDEIAATIDRLAAAWSSYGPAVDDAWHELPDSIDAEDWIAAHRADSVAAALALRSGDGESQATVVYTPMHGVGGAPTVQAFRAAGLPEPIIVESQFEPDAAFPTVSFPNPEEAGALDHALAVAAEHDADLIVAQDPDADRLAIAVRSRSGSGHTSPSHTMLSGDELGVLLGDHLIRQTSGDRLVARSVVSSRLLDAVANHAGVHCQVTLTGFKWIARAVVDHPDKQWLLGYEEALGYSIGTHVRDKDGITAALVAVQLVNELQAAGETVWDRLDQIAATHGVYASRPVTARFDADPDQIGLIIDRLVADPPQELAGAAVSQSGAIGGGALPPTPGMELLTADKTRVIVRPSGTEPKVKAYVEVVIPVSAGTVEAARVTAQERLDLICAEVSDWFSV